MPLFENGRDFQFHNSTFTDVARDNHIHYDSKETGEFAPFSADIETYVSYKSQSVEDA